MYEKIEPWEEKLDELQRSAHEINTRRKTLTTRIYRYFLYISFLCF